MVGDGGLMMRGISGGERKRLTTAEMVVGPQRVLLMDEISTGLDSATLFSVISFFTAVRVGWCRWHVQKQQSSCCLSLAAARLLNQLWKELTPAHPNQQWYAPLASLLTDVCRGCWLADVACAEPDNHYQPAAAAAGGFQHV